MGSKHELLVKDLAQLLKVLGVKVNYGGTREEDLEELVRDILTYLKSRRS